MAKSEIRSMIDGAVGVVTCEGRLDRSARASLLAETEHLFASGVPRLVIDCSAVVKIDRDGVAALEDVAVCCIARGVACRLRATSTMVDSLAASGASNAFSSWISVQIVDADGAAVRRSRTRSTAQERTTERRHAGERTLSLDGSA